MVLPQITTPLLETLQIGFFYQPTILVPHLSQYMSSTESLRSSNIKLVFYSSHFTLIVYHREYANMIPYTLWLQIRINELDRQVASAAQILHALGAALTTVETLTLKHDDDSELHEEAHRSRWRDLLRSLGNVKTLRVFGGLVGELSRCLRSDETEPPMELLPKLKVLEYIATDDASDPFASFIDACKNAGHPVALVRH
jgi:hypothetical protein